MLKGIDPLLHADLLHVLALMGHGDELVIADRNFPAVSVSRRLVRLDGVDAVRAIDAILRVFPLDSYVDDPVVRMQVVDSPDEITPNISLLTFSVAYLFV